MQGIAILFIKLSHKALKTCGSILDLYDAILFPMEMSCPFKLCVKKIKVKTNLPIQSSLLN